MEYLFYMARLSHEETVRAPARCLKSTTRSLTEKIKENQSKSKKSSQI